MSTAAVASCPGEPPSGGKHLVFTASKHERVSNLLVSTLATVGIDQPALGDSTGPLAGV